MPRIRRAYQSDVNDPKEALDAQCNRLPRLQNDQHTLVVKSVILRSHPVGGDRMQFHQLKRRAAFNINAEC